MDPLRDLEFGMTIRNGVFPAELAGSDVVGDVILIAMTLRRGSIPWIPDFGTDSNDLVFSNLGRVELQNELQSRVRGLFSAYLPYVTIAGTELEVKQEGGDDIYYFTVRYSYRGVEGVTAPIRLGGAG